MTVAADADVTTAPGEFLAPYVPAPEAIVDRMLELARVGPGDTVYDLGSGDGRIVVAAAQRFGSRAVGVELDDHRFSLSSARVRDLGLAPRARIVHGDLRSVDLTPATVVTLYQLPAVNAMLRPVLERQLQSGARVVALDFPVAGWEAARVVTGRLDGSPHAIFLYDISEVRKGSAMASDIRSYAAEHFSLELAGMPAGSLKSYEGGDATSEVVTEKVGPDGVVRKHLAGVRYQDIAVRFGTGMSSSLYDWIATTLLRNFVRNDGALIGTDITEVERWRLAFFHGLISEITFPACDTSSNNPAYIGLKISPEYTRAAPPTGQRGTISPGKRALLVSSDFQLKIDGLVCTGVRAIDALTVVSQVAEDAVGELRDYEKVPATLQVPNLAVSFAETDKDGFRTWYEDFVIKGNNNQSAERSGTLEYLANKKEVLFRVTFANLGIFKLTRASAVSGTNATQLTRAEMYCEEIRFEYGPSVPADKAAGATQGAGTVTAPASVPQLAVPLSVPVSALASLPSAADKYRIAALPQDLAAAAPPPLGRPLRFRT